MKYCIKCKKIYSDSEQNCSSCKISLTEINDRNTSVFLVSVGGTDRVRIVAALQDMDIPFTEKKHKKMAVADAAIGPENIDVNIYVPFFVYEKAYDVCVGAGAIVPKGIKEFDENMTEADFENHKAEEKFVDSVQSMSPAKRTTWRIISAILFILLCAAVIFGVDFIAEYIKGLFM